MIDAVKGLLVLFLLPLMFLWSILVGVGRLVRFAGGGAWGVATARRTVRLNPPGRAQSKKRRPVIRVCDPLRRMMVRWFKEDGGELARPILAYRDKPIASYKTGWRALRADCGFDDTVQPYSFRHTVARWCRSQSVPPWEVSALLGHSLPGTSTTELYAAADPAYMAASRKAIAALFRAISAPPPERGKGKPKRGQALGRVAQRESIRFTREGSQVQSLSRPPSPDGPAACRLRRSTPRSSARRHSAQAR